MSTLKRKALSLQEKMHILRVFDEKVSTGKNQTVIAAELQLPVSTLRTIVKNRGEIEEQYRLGGGVERKKQKVGKFDKLERVLVEWLQETRALGLPINGPIICKKARSIAESLQITDFTASSGWLNRFKNRHSIEYSRTRNTSESMTLQQHVDMWMTTLPELLQNYESKNIYTADEFSLTYRLIPSESYIKKETIYTGKTITGRLTILACTNNDGSVKLPLLVIGKNKNPRSFTGVKTLPVIYDIQPQACMTRDRFIEWLKVLDNHFQMQCRHIILFINDCPTHPTDFELKNIKLVFFPTAIIDLQPMSQGIIKIIKEGYKTRLMHYNQREQVSSRNLTILDVVIYIASAWEAVKPETIRNCFKEAGFRYKETRVTLEDSPEQSCFIDNDATYENQSSEDPIKVDVVLKKEKSVPFHISPEYSSKNKNQSNEHLIENVMAEHQIFSEDDDDDEEAAPIISNSQALMAVDDLRCYVASVSGSEKALKKLNYIENLVIANASNCISN